MSRFKHLSLALLACAMFAAAPAAIAAQSQQPRVDVDELTDSLILITGATLANQLQQSPPQNLPESFLNAQYVDPTVDPATRGQRGLIPLDDIDGIETSVAYTIERKPDLPDGVTKTSNTNTLTYVIFYPSQLADDELLGDDDEVEDNHLSNTMDQIEDGIEEQFTANSASTQVGVKLTGVETIDDDDDSTLGAPVDGLLATYTLSSGSTKAAAQLNIVQIGNVFIFGLVTVGADGLVNEDELADTTEFLAEDLTVAGIAHLATTVETIEQQP